MNSDMLYNLMFAGCVGAVGLLPKSGLRGIILPLLFLLPLLSLALCVYTVFFSSITWSNDPTSDTNVRYKRSMYRSTAFFLALSIIYLLVPVRTNLKYVYLTTCVVSFLEYIYDRAISLDDGLAITTSDPFQGIKLALMSVCSPSFMRFLMVLIIEVVLTLLLATVLVPLIPKQCTMLRYFFESYMIPFVIFVSVTGPLRFKWAHPNVEYSERIGYLPVYILCFFLVGLLTYLGRFNAFPLCITIGLGFLIQFSGVSDAPADYSLKNEVVFPDWAGVPLGLFVLVASMVLAWRMVSQKL